MNTVFDNSIEIIVDEDAIYSNLAFGSNALHSLICYPFTNLLPKKFSSWLYTKSCKDAYRIKDYATTHKAIEIIYSYEGFRINGNGVFDGMTTYLWQNGLLNTKALRNRLKLVKKILSKTIVGYNGRGRIRVLSLASGSARGVIEVLSELNGVDVEARFVDMSRNALNYSKELADRKKVLEKITLVRSDIRKFDKFCNDWSPDIVEAVGLFDYLDDDEALDLIRKIHDSMGSGGTMIIANINDNPERRFVSEVVGWKMVYRTPQELGELLIKGGFEGRNCRIICEPICIHSIAVATKFE